MLHPSYSEVDEDKLREDYFLASALWYRETLKEKVMSKKNALTFNFFPQNLYIRKKCSTFASELKNKDVQLLLNIIYLKH